ncbi:MAG: N-acetyl-gamma-glutamyl-phosphate reductase [Calditrichaeota bacterium]|nr:N-acetyl-gamma-glutamyl-phosphate reductase [Calditrichota bacterium]
MGDRKIQVGIAGASGYVGGELLRLLLHHPMIHIRFLFSRGHAGQPVSAVHPDLLGECDLLFTDQWQPDVDVLFLALGHGVSRAFLTDHPVSPHTRIIDLSRDFRPPQDDGLFVYGLPEWNRERIQQAQRVANPGCFATAIQLGLLPLAANQLLEFPIHVQAITGSTGAGKGLKATTHFTWRAQNVTVYQPFEHPHLPEIQATLREVQTGTAPELYFIPMRGNFTRGIYAVLYTRFLSSGAFDLFRDYYAEHPFVHLTPQIPDLKSVINTNKAILHVQQKGDQLLVISTIDNLLKGAAGQAVQNMNLMFGWPETLGLRMKAVAY